MQKIHFLLCLTALGFGPLKADTQLAIETQTAKAFAKYGITGKGVIVAILDRGIDYAHPDFRHADGTTRILYLLDMSGQNLCASNNPAPLEYNASQINTALQTGTPLNTRDAVGHGTVTAGIAAGNGSAFGAGQYAGMAPEADLLIVKVTSEGAPAHGNQPAESAFQGCYSQALDWVIAKANLVGEPLVALINSGTQWGPLDGTSALSQKIDQDFRSNQPGRAYVAASGDEGTLPNHAGSDYTASGPTTVNFSKSNTTTTYMQIWYTGSQPANITMTFADDGAAIGPVGPGGNASSDGITIFQYNPGQQFYPWTSSGPDRAAWIQIVGHSGAGTLQIQGTQAGSGHADFYGDATPVITFTDHLVAGRLNDYSSTSSAIVTGCYNLRTSWVDIDGNPQSFTSQGSTGQLWTLSSGGPTRDGRVPPAGGVDLTTPGGNVFGAYGQNSYWETFRFNLVQDGGGWYGRQSATSGASPVTVGAAALLLQMNSGLTGGAIKTILHNTSLSDSSTGPTPNSNWGLGKLDVLAAADAIAAAIPANPVISLGAITFPAQQVGTTSSPISIQLLNTGTAALTVISISTSGDFVLSGQNCGSSVAAGGSCVISIGFSPSGTGNRTGTLTIKDINGSSPQTVVLTGTGRIPSATHFVPVTPCRIADTRDPNNPFGGPAITGGASRDFVIPNSACGIPSTAAAYSMNVAVVPSGPLGYLTLWPSGQSQPLVATLNSIDGRVKSNAAIVPAGSNGAVSVFATDTTDVILDINGYFVAGSSPSAMAFYPLTPCRIADTRNAAGPLGAPSLAAKGTRSFPIQASSCGVPASAQAYSVNFAAVPRGPLGYITAWPAGQPQPVVSSLNDPTGTVLANAVVVPAGTNGDVSVYTTDATDLVIDINGYFAPQRPGGLSLYTVTPCRVLDSRLSGTPPFSTTQDVNVTASPCGVPATAKAFVFNATVVPPGPLGFITMWPQGQSNPGTATLNAYDGAVTNNMAIVPTTTGSISVFPFNPTHLVLDIFGYFAP